MLLSGTMSLSRKVGTDDVEIDAHRPGRRLHGRRAGLPGDRTCSRGTPQRCRVVTDARFFVLAGEDFAHRGPHLVPDGDPPAGGPVPGHAEPRQQIVSQRQQLLALGALAAGLTHELNNPAAAAVRATAGLRKRVAGMRHKLAMLAHDELDPKLLEVLVDVQEEAVQAVALRPRPVRRGGVRARGRADRLAGRARRQRRVGARPDLRRGRAPRPSSWTRSPRSPAPSCSTAGCAGWPTPSRPSCCSPRSPTRSPASRRWSTRPSSTRTWTVRRSSGPTSTRGSRARW